MDVAIPQSMSAKKNYIRSSLYPHISKLQTKAERNLKPKRPFWSRHLDAQEVALLSFIKFQTV